MRRKLLLYGVVLFVLLCSSLVVSVDAASMWSQTYGGAGIDVAFSLVATSDGGYVIAGEIGYAMAALVKTDAFGNMQWNKTYGASWGVAYSVVATSDGGYAIAGVVNDDFWLIKTDAFGNMQWNQTYGGSGEDVACSLVATSDGGYAIAGVWGCDNNLGFFDMIFSSGDAWLVKTDALGNMQWNRTYGGTGADWAASLVETPDGGYVIAGTFNYTAVTEGWGGGDFWLIKTDTLGNMGWSRTYGGTGNDEAYSLVATSDGGYAIAGAWNSTGPFWSGYTDYWLVKTDALGNMQWNKTYGGTGGAEVARSLVATSDGGYAIAGTYDYTGAWGMDYLDDDDFWLVKTDSLGDMNWSRTYSGGRADHAYSLVATSDGGYAIAGTYDYAMDIFYSNRGDFWLVKTDENGVLPEYSSLLVPALVLTATAFILINKKRRPPTCS